MKIVEPGPERAVKCAYCGALLRIQLSDIYRASNGNYAPTHHNSLYFTCPCCNYEMNGEVYRKDMLLEIGRSDSH